MRPLTPKQERILQFIEESWLAHGVSPSYGQIQERFGFASPHAVTKHVAALLKKGHLRGLRDSSGRLRSLVSARSFDKKEVPLLGRIAAGRPLEAIEHIQTTMDLSGLGIDNRKRDHFALSVRGESMINAHIMDGDCVVIKKQASVLPRDIAAVLYNGEATLKYVRRKGDSVLLVPANDTMQPIAVNPNSEFQILGKVVKIIRSI